MRMWHNVKFLILHDLRRSVVPAVLTGLLYGLVGISTGGMVRGAESLDQTDKVARVIQQTTSDWMVFCLVTCLGFIFTKDYFSYYRNDAFSRRLAFYRKLPVSNHEILTARYGVFLLTAVAMSVCYYTPFYLVLCSGDGVAGGEFLGSAFIWLGLTLFVGACFIHLELGYPGKKYLIVNMFIVGICLLLIVCLNILDIHLVSGSFSLIRHYAAWPSVLSVLAGAAGAWLFSKKTLRRLAARDLL